jgi:hypothetical protein
VGKCRLARVHPRDTPALRETVGDRTVAAPDVEDGLDIGGDEAFEDGDLLLDVREEMKASPESRLLESTGCARHVMRRPFAAA